MSIVLVWMGRTCSQMALIMPPMMEKVTLTFLGVRVAPVVAAVVAASGNDSAEVSLGSDDWVSLENESSLCQVFRCCPRYYRDQYQI